MSDHLRRMLGLLWLTITVAVAVRLVTGSEGWAGMALVVTAIAAGAVAPTGHDARWRPRSADGPPRWGTGPGNPGGDRSA